MGGLLAIDSDKDLALVLEIGRHQESGTPLTQKQLCLSGIAPAATVRRRLRRLVGNRIIEKTISESDGRSVLLLLSDVAQRHLRHVCRSIKQLEW